MPPVHHQIDLKDKNAGTLSVNQGDTIAWHNDTRSDISLNPPSCVSPPGQTDIAAGATSKNFTVNGTKGQSYDYSFDVGAELGTRNGTIAVNN